MIILDNFSTRSVEDQLDFEETKSLPKIHKIQSQHLHAGTKCDPVTIFEPQPAEAYRKHATKLLKWGTKNHQENHWKVDSFQIIFVWKRSLGFSLHEKGSCVRMSLFMLGFKASSLTKPTTDNQRVSHHTSSTLIPPCEKNCSENFFFVMWIECGTELQNWVNHPYLSSNHQS